MSLRKSPTLTPALLAACRRNAQKSTGPRTARGKAWVRLNHLRSGAKSPGFASFVDSLLHAPPGRVDLVADALLQAQDVPHPLFVEMAELAIQAEFELCTGTRRQGLGRRQKKDFVRSKRECV